MFLLKYAFSKTVTKSEPDGKEEAWKTLTDALDNLEKDCGRYSKMSDKKDNETDDSKKTKVAAGVTGAITAIAGGALTYHITKAVRDQMLDEAEREAYDKFMEEIGSHIFCYIGGEEAGSYGDVITTSME